MDDQLRLLQDAFEDDGYDVLDITQNRTQIRVVLAEDRADAEQLRSITDRVFDASELLGVNVTTESVDGQDGTNTVVSCRVRTST